MNNIILTPHNDRNEGKRMWLEWEMDQEKGNADSAVRKRFAFGVVLLFGLIALIGFSLQGDHIFAVIAAADLLIGCLVLINELLKIRWTYRTVNMHKAWYRIASLAHTTETGIESDKMQEVIFLRTLTDGIGDARTALVELNIMRNRLLRNNLVQADAALESCTDFRIYWTSDNEY